MDISWERLQTLLCLCRLEMVVKVNVVGTGFHRPKVCVRVEGYVTLISECFRCSPNLDSQLMPTKGLTKH